MPHQDRACGQSGFRNTPPNYNTPITNNSIQRELAGRLSPTANISMRINEMGLTRPKNP